jgi:RHS repeat-associated protein
MIGAKIGGKKLVLSGILAFVLAVVPMLDLARACPPCIGGGSSCCDWANTIYHYPGDCSTKLSGVSDTSYQSLLPPLSTGTPTAAMDGGVQIWCDLATAGYVPSDTPGLTTCQTQTVAFTKPWAGGNPSGSYTPKDATVTATLYSTGSSSMVFGKGGHVVAPSQGGCTVVTPEGNQLLQGGATTLYQGKDLLTSTTGTGWTTITDTRSGTTIKTTYIRDTYDSTVKVRRRVTVVEFNSDGSKTYLTTLYGYYGSGTSWPAQLRFIVKPDGVARYLAAHPGDGVSIADPSGSCNLDTATAFDPTDPAYDNYAAVFCSAYNGAYQVTTVSGEGGACCGGAGGEDGNYAFDYGPAQTRTPSSEFNDWATYRRTTAPSGLKTVEFLNKHNLIVFKVVQNESDIANKSWITHYKYDSKGRVVEHRYPSACAGYLAHVTGVWADGMTTIVENGTVGLVRLYSFDDTKGGNLSWEKVGNGTGGTTTKTLREYTYDSHSWTVPGYQATWVYPVASETVHIDDATSQTTTYHVDSWSTDWNAPQQKTVTYPSVSTNNNGPGATTQEVYHYKLADGLYYNDWTQYPGPGGTYSYAYTQLGTGTYNYNQVTMSIVDAYTGQGSGLPNGWTLPSSSNALGLTTTYAYYDATGSWGRLKSVTNPAGTNTVYAYMSVEKTDAGPTHETTTALATLVAPHMTSGGDYGLAPTEIAVTDLAGRTLVSAAGLSGSNSDGNTQGQGLLNDWSSGGTIDDDFTAFVRDANGFLSARTVTSYTTKGQVSTVARWPDADATGLNPAKYTITYGYDDYGRQQTVTAPDGTITFTQYDSFKLDRPVATWVGTDATGATQTTPAGNGNNNLKQVSATFFDEVDVDDVPSQGVGDGNVTRTQAFYDGNDAHHYDTLYQYDWRNRLLQTRGPDNVTVKRTLDFLGRAYVVETYHDGGTPNWTIDANEMLARTGTEYDEKGQVFRTHAYKVVNGAATDASDRLTTNYWYDPRGRLVKVREPNGLYRKTAYDGAGRPTAAYLCYSESDPEGYTASGSVTGNKVIEQTRMYYTDAGATPRDFGNVTRSWHSQRNDGDTTSTGELTTSNARLTLTASWYDDVGRAVRTADYGAVTAAELTGGDLTNYNPADGTSRTYDWCRTNNKPEPNSSDNVVVAAYHFDTAGRLDVVTDNMARETHKTFNDLGRVTKVIEHYTGNGSVTATSYDFNRTTEYGFDTAGRLTSLKAYNPNGTEVVTQETKYVYGSTTTESQIARGDLLRAEIYPDSDDTTALGNGADQVYDRVEYTYDRLGRRNTMKDQREVVHTYAYAYASDKLTLTDTVTGTAGDYLDLTTLKIESVRDYLGRLESVTSRGAGNALLNQVTLTRGDDGWGGVTASQQTHKSNEDSPPSVAYAYDVSVASSEAAYVRLGHVTYPSASRAVYYNYTASGVGGALNRLDNIADTAEATTKYAQYTYLGAGTIVNVAHPAVTGGLNLAYGSAGTYGGFDRFGRVVDQKWQNNAGSTPAFDRYTYGYDGNSNRLYRKNEVAAAQSELYHANGSNGYDGLDRLKEFGRGTLSTDKLSIASNAAGREVYSLDGLGNWTEFQKSATDGTTWDLDQDRSHNAANEIDGNSGNPIRPHPGSNTPDWVDPVYDAAGNMTQGPKPAAETTRLHFVYDAWNRQVAVRSDNNGPGTVVVKCQYDGLNRRIAKLRYVDGTNWDRTDYYYNEAWQCLEERRGSVSGETTVATTVNCQYVWDIRYIDAPVLRDRDAAAGGDLGWMGSGLDERRYYTNDANMNVTALVNTSGTVVERYVYDPYGKVTFLQGDWSLQHVEGQADGTVSAYANEILYCGYRYEPETGQYLARERYYHPTLARWTSRDPAAQTQVLGSLVLLPAFDNLYEYVGANPTKFTDPSGLKKASVRVARNGKLNVMNRDHTWIEYGDGQLDAGDESQKLTSIGYAPPAPADKSDKLRAIDGTPGNVSSPDVFHAHDPDTRWWAPQDESAERFLQAGKAKGKCCKDADDEDVYDCLRAVGKEWDGSTYRLVTRNCRHFVRDALTKCCLHWPREMLSDTDYISDWVRTLPGFGLFPLPIPTLPAVPPELPQWPS